MSPAKKAPITDTGPRRPRVVIARSPPTSAAPGATGVRTRAEDVTERLRELILSGQLGPHRKLQEMQLATILGVSRTPVRNALGVLEREGLVEYKPNRGFWVREFSIREVLEAYSVRAVLEGYACRLVANTVAPDRVLKRLRRTISEYGQIVAKMALDDFDRLAVMELNQIFHQTILEQAGNDMLQDLAIQAQQVPMATLNVIPRWRLHDDLEGARLSHRDHVELLDAIERGDGEGADTAMQTHIRRAASLVARQYEAALEVGVRDTGEA